MHACIYTHIHTHTHTYTLHTVCLQALEPHVQAAIYSSTRGCVCMCVCVCLLQHSVDGVYKLLRNKRDSIAFELPGGGSAPVFIDELPETVQKKLTP